MFILLTIQLIFTSTCIYYLVKQIDLRTSTLRKTIYTIVAFIVLFVALGAPLLLNNLSNIMRGFFIYIVLYTTTVPLVFPDQIMKDKNHTSLIALTDYILIYYIVIYVPLLMFNLSNTLTPLKLFGKTILFISIFLMVVFALKNINKLFMKRTHIIYASVSILIVVLGGFLLSYQVIGRVSVSNYNSRETNNILFSDDFYLARVYEFQVDNVGTELYDFAKDDDFLYLLTRDFQAESIYILLLDINSLELVKTYEFNQYNTDYSWYIYKEQDFLFNQDNTIYFTFIDGIYTVDETTTTKISNISDLTSHRFIYNDKVHFVDRDQTEYSIYSLNKDGLTYIETIIDPENNLVVNSVNNYLSIKDKNKEEVLIYPDTVYKIPTSMIYYPVLSVNDTRIILGDDQNTELLDDGIQAEKFSYYAIDGNFNAELMQSNDYMFEISEFRFQSTAVLYEVFPTPKTYDSKLEDIDFPIEFISESDEYNFKREIVEKDDKLYSILYRVDDFETNHIFVEINEVQELVKTYDLGAFTNFAKETFIFIVLITFTFSCNVILKRNFLTKKKL